MSDPLDTSYDCRFCEKQGQKDSFFHAQFIVCPTCGNKRCPKASAHWQECTGSNADGQYGSYYGPNEHWPTAAPATERQRLQKQIRAADELTAEAQRNGEYGPATPGNSADEKGNR